ncbi:MAG: penicillin-binding protein activator [Parvibaculales bacterium]
MMKRYLKFLISGAISVTLVACGQPGGPNGRADLEPAPAETSSAYTVLIPNASTSSDISGAPNQRIVENTKAFLRALPKSQAPATAYDSQMKEEGFLTRAVSGKGFGRANDARIRIGLILPLSAESQDVQKIAQELFNAAQLGLFDIRRPELTLLVQDTQGTTKGAERAARKVLQDGADIIIGPLFAANTKAITPLARNAGVPILSLSNNRDVAGNGVWLLGFLPEQNLDRIISEASARGLTRFAALIPETPYGKRIQTALEPTINFYGGELIQVETYQDEAQSMLIPAQRIAQYEERKQAWQDERDRLTEEAGILLSTLPEPPLITEETPAEEIWEQIEEINPDLKAQYDAMRLTETFGELPYDAVIMPEGGVRLRSLAPLLPYFDVDPRQIKFLGTGLWDDPVLGQEPPLLGGWYAAPDPKGWQNFERRYQKIYGNAPPRLAGLAYDSISLVAALTDIYPNSPFTYKSLTDPNGFLGIDGIFRLTENGLNERGLAVLEIRRKRNRLIAESPNNFINLDQQPKRPIQKIQTPQDKKKDSLFAPFSVFN